MLCVSAGNLLNKQYLEEIWSRFQEPFLIDLIEKVYQNLGYSVTNFHRSDRIHEDGVDLLADKGNEKIAFQIKMKPGTKDIDQLKRFSKTSSKIKAIYVHIYDPTKPFKDFADAHQLNVEFWDSIRLHSFLVENECVDYLCLYFACHPLIKSILRVYESILLRRKTAFVKGQYTKDELVRLWAVKDNSVKLWVPLQFTYRKWNPTLMAKTQKEKDEFQDILTSVFKDMNMVYHLCGEKLVASFEDIAEKHPNIIGLYWDIISQRTNWINFTTCVDHKTNTMKEALFFSLYYWVCPVFNDAKKANMAGFYSTVNYLLENLQTIAKDIEYGIDWVFEDLVDVEIASYHQDNGKKC